MQTIILSNYLIQIDNLQQTFQQHLQEQKYTKIIVLTDQHTHTHCLNKFTQLTGLHNFPEITIPAGEIHKNIITCQQIWQGLFDAGADRKSLLVCLGGGVIGDMGGFCAATYKRGIAFIQVPTTLLSQVDSSIGGKLGIDFGQVKNSVGVFANPAAVFISRDFLYTLPEREIRSGFSEMLKHALIANANQWTRLAKILALDYAALDKMHQELAPSLMVKKRIVKTDPFEMGIRKALNFGHTIGHAIESMSLETDKPLLHGEAIAIGMICESYLSEQILNMSGLKEITHTLLRFYGKYDISHFKRSHLIDIMQQDKKNEGGQINFTLLTAIGFAEINQTAPHDLISKALDYYQAL